MTRSHAQRQRSTAKRLLRSLYGRDAVPGIILGDEVGMGKTYEVFGVIAALFRNNPEARVTVLAHSASMAETWRLRWNRFRQKNVAAKYRERLPTGTCLNDPTDIGKPGLFLGSYETFKRNSAQHQRALLEWVLDGSGLHESTRRRLRWNLFGTHRPGGDLDHRQPSQQARTSLLELLRDETATPYAILHQLRRMVLRCFRTRRRLDLLVVDEAHKVRDGQREVFFTEVLDGRADHVLYVTATPFALDLTQLLDLIEDMFECVGVDTSPVQHLQDSLNQFRKIVESRAELSQQCRAALQQELGAYLVRSCWPPLLPSAKRRPPVPRRLLRHLGSTTKSKLSIESTLASLALETAFRRLQDQNARTHRATHRETLCSSYTAIRRKVAERPPTHSPFAQHLRALVKLIPSGHESPKFDQAADFLQDMARKRHKVVVFCKRLATAHKLRSELHSALNEERNRAAKLWKSALRKLTRLAASAEDKNLTRIAIYSTGHKTCPVLPRTRKKLEIAARKAEPNEDLRQDFLSQTWGSRRRIDWVAELTGETGSSEEGGRSREAVRFSFNLPGPPYILVCTNIAGEGIDLHYYCRRIMHYDLEWNPAVMEQQVGRLDRLGSFSSRTGKPIEVLFVYQPRTYEERIAKVVQRRCEMLRILLGAGHWLADDPSDQMDLTNLEKYRLDFSP